jgi:hypothetical protein
MQAMPAIFFLLLSTYLGRRLCQLLLPNLDRAGYVARWVIALPAAFLSGTLLVTWATYLTASAMRHSESPMAIANIIVMSTLSIVLAGDFFYRRRRGRNATPVATETHRRLSFDVAIAATGVLLGAVIMFHTCRIEGDTLILGRTAFGDLNIHLGMARSFSRGNNFPTGYMAYAGSDIRYHFMFYFLVGNLEFLGLRLDWAINLPSILAFASVLMLLHALGSGVGRDARVGALTVLFFLMRSSPAAFVYFAHLPGGLADKFRALFQTRTFIGLTTHETWGIWNLNVYVVERHFGFAFGLVLIALLYLVRISGLDSGPSLLRAPWGKPSRHASSPS